MEVFSESAVLDIVNWDGLSKERCLVFAWLSKIDTRPRHGSAKRAHGIFGAPQLK